MKKPQFEQFRTQTLRGGKALQQQLREPYRVAMVAALEGTGDILIQRARKDGHDDALVELHGSWIGTAFDPDDVIGLLKKIWPGEIFSGGEEMHWIEREDEIVLLESAWTDETKRFVTARVKITP